MTTHYASIRYVCRCLAAWPATACMRNGSRKYPLLSFMFFAHTQMETRILSDWSEQFCRLSLLHSRLVTVTEYMEEVIKTMCESWEDGLLVMDTKLANYSSVSVCVSLSLSLTTLECVCVYVSNYSSVSVWGSAFVNTMLSTPLRGDPWVKWSTSSHVESLCAKACCGFVYVVLSTGCRLMAPLSACQACKSAENLQHSQRSCHHLDLW